MGLLNLFDKKGKRASLKDDDGDELVTVKIKKSQLELFNQVMSFVNAFDGPDGEDKLDRLDEELEKEKLRGELELEEQQRRRREALEERGVLTSSITIDKGRKDLFEMAKNLCGIDLSAFGPCAREVVSWQRLTETGKVPKCVAIYCTYWDIRDNRFHTSTVTCEVSYLADGTAYTAWITDLRGSGTYYKIKTVDGKLALVAANPA